MRFNVGDKVLIKKELGSRKNCDGLMDKYCGTIMTIRELKSESYLPYYRMAEDKGEWGGDGWLWFEEMVECQVVNRKAKDGEYIIITNTNDSRYEDGEIFKVDCVRPYGLRSRLKNDDMIYISDCECQVLEDYKTEEKEMPVKFEAPKPSFKQAMYNLVFVQFAHEGKGYLYQLPMETELHYGDKVFVDARGRQQKVECVSDSFKVTGTTLVALKAELGIDMVIKNVLGYAVEKKEYDLVSF